MSLKTLFGHTKLNLSQHPLFFVFFVLAAHVVRINTQNENYLEETEMNMSSHGSHLLQLLIFKKNSSSDGTTTNYEIETLKTP